jgi:2-polyprenyl-6-methoxyphenol hydroxylase-like FAD-dependent oxidoreductase
MPPGGSSAGLAFEDAIILSRIISQNSINTTSELEATFVRYDTFRRPRVMKDWKQKASQWEGTKNHGWLMQKIRETFVWALLPMIARHMEEGFRYNPINVELPK